MNNDKLSAAITAAYERCASTYTSGHLTGNSEAGKIMLDHLKALLAVQLERARIEPADSNLLARLQREGLGLSSAND